MAKKKAQIDVVEDVDAILSGEVAMPKIKVATPEKIPTFEEMVKMVTPPDIPGDFKTAKNWDDFVAGLTYAMFKKHEKAHDKPYWDTLKIPMEWRA